MGQPQLKEVYYTYEDYVSWEAEERYELIDGVPYLMAAPSIMHQIISMNLSLAVGSYLKGKQCQALTGPIDVRLNHDKGDDTVVQPDLVVVCDKEKIGKNTIKGAPDIVMEIISPSSVQRDRLIKFNRYQQAGVREYWILSPGETSAEVYVLVEGIYQTHGVYTRSDIATSVVLEELKIPLTDIFEADED